MMVYLLVEAEEGNLGHVFSGLHLHRLMRSIRDFYANEESSARSDEDRLMYREECAAVLKMLDAAPSEPGHHKLTPSNPLWHEWVLVNVECGGFSGGERLGDVVIDVPTAGLGADVPQALTTGK
jgi:hypothetical protein